MLKNKQEPSGEVVTVMKPQPNLRSTQMGMA
jgi:hypothetical protein